MRTASESDVIVLPLPSGAYALGVVVRVGRRGSCLLCAFWGPRQRSLRGLRPGRLKPSSAVLWGLCGQMAVKSGEWHVAGCMSPWDRRVWRPPLMTSEYDGTPGSRCWLVCLDDDLEPVRLRRVDYDESMPSYGMAGTLWIQERLDLLL